MVLVVGATGSLGTKIARRLLDQGEDVRILARARSKYAPLEEAGAEVAFGDLKDPGSLERACRGVDVVISTATSAGRGGEDNVETVDFRGNRDLIDAAVSAGVRQLIFVSTVSASADSPVPLLRAKAATEEYLRGSGLDYTILSATAFMDVWFPMIVEGAVARGEPVTLVGASRARHSFVAENDVAAFAVAAVRNAEARDASIAVAGPEAVTFGDVARAYEQALGREVPVRSVAPGEPIPGLPERVWGLAAALQTFDSSVPMEDTARRFQVTPTSVNDFAARSTLANPMRA